MEHGLDGIALHHQEDTALTNSDVIYSLDAPENLGNNVQKDFWFSYFLWIYSQNTLAVILGDYYNKTLSHPNAVWEVAKEQTNTSRATAGKLGELQPVARQCSIGFCSKELRQRSSKTQVNRKHDPCCSWGGYCSQNRPRSAQNCLEFIQHSWHEGNTDGTEVTYWCGSLYPLSMKGTVRCPEASERSKTICSPLLGWLWKATALEPYWWC